MNENRTNTGMVVEIIGPAAVGKSSVVRHLLEQNSAFRKYVPSRRYLWECWKYTILRFPRILVLLLFGARRHSLKTLIRIEAALAEISKLQNRPPVLLIDQGPLALLAYLHFKKAPNRWLACWLDRLQKKAGRVIDRVFWLDAPNAVLIERLRNRNDGHAMETLPDAQVNQFYDSYRLGYTKAIGHIHHKLIDTERLSVGEISHIIRLELMEK
jgi:thymidylate kinase